MKKLVLGLCLATIYGCGGEQADLLPTNSEQATGLHKTEAGAWVGVVDHGETSCPIPSEGEWGASKGTGPFERFCTYTFIGGPGSAFEHLSNLTGIHSVAPLNMGRVLPMAAPATPLVGNLRGVLWQTFLEDLAWVPPLSADSLLSKVEIHLLDTLGPKSVAPRSIHGTSLKSIAEGILCQGNHCAAQIVPHLALTRLAHGQIDPINGGFHATVWELAQSIRLAADKVKPSKNGIINLSLAWPDSSNYTFPSTHEALLTGNYNSIPATERAVHAAITYARCKGVMVFSAAGNDLTGIGQTGPMLPAAWSVLPDLTPAACSAVGISMGTGTDDRPQHFLVAVGGLGHGGRPLANARERGTPEIVAPGYQVVHEDKKGSSLTGTSVSTMVVSSLAALAWSLAPQLNAEGVLSIVRSAAQTLPRAAEFCSGPRCGAQKWVSMCETQRLACQSSGNCSSAACLPRAIGQKGPNSLNLGHLLAAGGRTVAGGAKLHTWPRTIHLRGSGNCQTILSTSTTADCPANREPSTEALDVSPQPIDPMCPACFVAAYGPDLWFVADTIPSSVISSGYLHNPMLTIRGPNGYESHISLPQAVPVGAQEVFSIGPASLLPAQATVTFKYLVYGPMTASNPDGKYYVSEPILAD